MNKTLSDEYIGMVFNRLTIISVGPPIHSKRRYWCVCECGNGVLVQLYKMKIGHTKSCGCLHKERAVEANTKHKLAKLYPNEYIIWEQMKSRCFCQANDKYDHYGGRGISVSDEWANSFDVFIMDMGARPNKTYSLERIDNDGNYEKSNTKWATKKEQAQNRRSSIWITHDGVSLVQKEWADKLCIKPQRIDYLLNHKQLPFSEIFNMYKHNIQN